MPNQSEINLDDADRSFTISEFCVLENFSLAYFYKLQKLGRAPRVLNPGGAIRRITADERRRWHEAMYKLAQKDEAKREAKRRSAVNSRAGKIAAASPLHYCNRKAR